jgi:N-acyl-D-amino-acid deacylase
MLDLLVKNAEIIDGTGVPAYKADVGISEGRIILIAADIEQEAGRIIQADDLHLAPGFIDPHMHSDITLLVNRKAESSIHQGVTTEVIGNCGFSPAPLYGDAIEGILALSSGLDIEFNWKSMGEYLDRLRKPGTALNVVPLVGHNTVRSAVLGNDDVEPTPGQQVEMESLVAEAMEQGARGMSTGLFYPPGCYSRIKEVIQLAKVAAQQGGIYVSHIRSESDQVLESTQEAVEIGVQAGIPVQFSHVKISGHRNWDMIDELIVLLESDNARDAQLGCDQYPYHASSTFLYSILPYWAQEGGGKTIAGRMVVERTRDLLKKDWEENQVEWDDRSGVADWDGILITGCPSRPEIMGMTVAEIASQDGVDPLDAALDLISLDNAQAAVVYFDQSEDIVRKLMRNPIVGVGSDSLGTSPYGVLGQRGAHPRGYGTFPRVLGRYVREENLLSLEEAVRKMTSFPAERFNLIDRGVIREGAWADIVLFDAETVSDNATFTQPHQYPEGVPYVIVNGEVVISQGEHTGALPGQVL